MDDTTKRTYIRGHLDRALDDLSSARDNLAQGHLRVSANRAYYVIFHAASAALLWLDIERAHHSGVESAFSEFLVKPKAIEPEFSRIYIKARRLREQQDYDLIATAISAQEAKRIVKDAYDFLERIEHYLREVGAIT